jgi:hypothetical protein
MIIYRQKRMLERVGLNRDLYRDLYIEARP